MRDHFSFFSAGSCLKWPFQWLYLLGSLGGHSKKHMPCINSSLKELHSGNHQTCALQARRVTHPSLGRHGVSWDSWHRPTKSSGKQLRPTIICVKCTIYLSSLLNTTISFFLGGKDEAGTWRMGATDTEKEKKVMATGSQDFTSSVIISSSKSTVLSLPIWNTVLPLDIYTDHIQQQKEWWLCVRIWNWSDNIQLAKLEHGWSFSISVA